LSATRIVESALWILFWFFVLFPVTLYLLYHFRRQRARIDKLLETLQGLGLADMYMQSRHRQDYQSWKDGGRSDSEFQKIVLTDFNIGLRRLDFLLPALIVTVLSAIGWGVTLGFTKTVNSLTHSNVVVPIAFIWGFVGAYFSNLGTLLNKFISYELGPIAYHQMYRRLLFSTVAAFLLGEVVKDSFTPLIAFGIGLIPYQDLWDTISTKTQTALGNKQAAGIPDEAALSNIQGLEDPSVREKLLELNVSTVQSLAMQDPLELFLRTSFPLRMIVDWIDRAILYGYLGKKTISLRERGINGAIEMGGLVELADKVPVETYHDGVLIREELKADFKNLDSSKLYQEIGETIGLKHEELLNLIYNLYYDPMVDTLYQIWGRN
jgi:hypothetical protein